MKKWMSMLASLSMVFSLAACSSSAPSGTKEQPKDGAKTESAPAKSDSSSGKTEITYLAISTWDPAITNTVQAFEKENPDIKVKLQLQPFRQLFETVEVQMNSKKPDFDVMSVDVPLVANYTVKGYLEPLDSYLDPDFKDKWVKSAVDAGSYNGKLMAAPMNTSSQALFYNKDIFQEKGITPPSFNPDERWTWEKVVETGKKLTYDKNGTQIFGFSFDQISRPYQTLALAHSLGAKVISDNGIVATGYTNSPEMVAAGKFYGDLFNTYKISPKITPEEAPDYFATGKVAMFVGGTWNAKRFADKGMNFGIAPHPYFEGKKMATPTGSWHVGISKFSTKKEAAAKFVKWLTYGNGSKVWFEQHGDVPANAALIKDINENPKYDKFPDNIMKLATYEAGHTAVPRPSSPGYLEWESMVNKAFEDIKNGVDAKKALDDASSQIDRQLKKYESVANK